jgi:septal ring factor EnvC (AmiA/AmiB activator)
MIQPDTTLLGRSPGRSAVCAALLIAWSLSARAATIEIYRCAGTPAVYTSDLRLVRAGRCTRMGAEPAAARVAAVAPVAASAVVRPAVPAGATIARDVQQQRDSDRLHILQTEQARERDRLTQLTQQLQQMQSAPAQDTNAKRAETSALSQAIQRSESDLQALDKELARAQQR